MHIVGGTKTHCVTAAEIHDRNTNDAIVLPSLIAGTAGRFNVKEVSGDVAHATQTNFGAVDKIGATLYATFRSNASGRPGGLFGKMFHLFCANREDYLSHYHRRSNVEKTQADYPSSRRWVGTRRIGYHRRDGVARVGRVVPATPGGHSPEEPHVRHHPTPRAPPRLTPTSAPTNDPPPVWAHLPADRQKQLHELLGQLLARLHAANARQEVGHE